MQRRAFFTPALFRFLSDLAAHNDPHWFEANRQRYEDDVRGPLLSFIASFSRPLRGISRQFVADPRPTGGSMFRIHRDIRFSPDKSPYKTHAAAQFRHTQGRDVHAPGFYFHLEPGNVFVAAGLWRPGPVELDRIRRAIAGNPARWKRIVGARAFRETLSLEGDSLVRPPRGFDPAHPLIEDLKRTDFVVTRGFSQRDACSPDFLEKVARAYRICAPFMRLLTEAVGLDF